MRHRIPASLSFHLVYCRSVSMMALLSHDGVLSLWTRKSNAASDKKPYSRHAHLGARKSREGCAIFCSSRKARNRSLLFLIGEKDNDLSRFPLAPCASHLCRVFITGAIPRQLTKGQNHDQQTITSRLSRQHAKEGGRQGCWTEVGAVWPHKNGERLDHLFTKVSAFTVELSAPSRRRKSRHRQNNLAFPPAGASVPVGGFLSIS